MAVSAIAAAVTTGLQVKQQVDQTRALKRARRAQEDAQRSALARSRAQSELAAQEFRRANAKKPNVSSILEAEQALTGLSSTNTAGPRGDGSPPALARPSLLGDPV